VRKLGLSLLDEGGGEDQHALIPPHVSDLSVDTDMICVSVDLSPKSMLVTLRVLLGFITDLIIPSPMDRLQVLHMKGFIDFHCFSGMPELRDLCLNNCAIGLGTASDEERVLCFSSLKNLQTLEIGDHTFISAEQSGWDLALSGLVCLPKLAEVTLNIRLPYEAAFCGTSSPLPDIARPVRLTLVGEANVLKRKSAEWAEIVTNEFVPVRASSFIGVSHLMLHKVCVYPTHLSDLGVRTVSLHINKK